MRVHHQVTCTVVLHIYIFFSPVTFISMSQTLKSCRSFFFCLCYHFIVHSILAFACFYYYIFVSNPVQTSVLSCVWPPMYTKLSICIPELLLCSILRALFLLAVPTVCFTTPEFFRLTICTYTWVVLCWHLVQSSRVKKKVPFFVKMCGGCISSACLTHAHMLLNEQH